MTPPVPRVGSPFDAAASMAAAAAAANFAASVGVPERPGSSLGKSKRGGRRGGSPSRSDPSRSDPSSDPGEIKRPRSALGDAARSHLSAPTPQRAVAPGLDALSAMAEIGSSGDVGGSTGAGAAALAAPVASRPLPGGFATAPSPASSPGYAQMMAAMAAAGIASPAPAPDAAAQQAATLAMLASMGPGGAEMMQAMFQQQQAQAQSQAQAMMAAAAAASAAGAPGAGGAPAAAAAAQAAQAYYQAMAAASFRRRLPGRDPPLRRRRLPRDPARCRTESSGPWATTWRCGGSGPRSTRGSPPGAPSAPAPEANGAQ